MSINPQLQTNEANDSLIVRLPNWVGDVIMTLPVLQTLNQSGIQIQLLGKPWVQDLLAAMNLPFQSLESSFFQTRKKLAAMQPDKLLLLTNSFSSAFMAKLAGKKCIGYSTDSRKFFLQAGLSKPNHLHEVQYFWEIARYAAARWFPFISWPEHIPDKLNLVPQQSSQEKISALLTKEKISSPFWVLCPFAQGKGEHNKSKIWPHWHDLFKQLSKNHTLVVCPGKNEEHLCEPLSPYARILPGLNLSELTAILAQAEQVISNDSGPMHIAAAVGAKTLGIFGATDPSRTSPWGGEFVGDLNKWPSIDEVLSHL